jgi:enoyl-CoA hydratase/carnithine racemase
MSQEITVSRIGRALHVRLDRAAKRNAITRSMYDAVTEAIVEAEADEAIRAVLFTGAGEAFCAGNDLNDFVADPPTGMDSPAFRFLRAISTAEKVLIASVHGSAVGVGTTMLLHCDLVVAARSARLSLPFVTLGLVPEAASTLLLPRAIGHLRSAPAAASRRADRCRDGIAMGPRQPCRRRRQADRRRDRIINARRFLATVGSSAHKATSERRPRRGRRSDRARGRHLCGPAQGS